MIRPRLRPTLSRKTKYLGIAPTAERRLGREARRGSHDLRRLVGHANFLDVLIETFDNDHDDVVTPPVPPSKEQQQPESKEEEEQLHNDSDTESDDSDVWSDEDNDDEHQLMRTASGRPLGAARDVQVEIVSPPENGGDYFNMPSGNPGESLEHLKGARQDIAASMQGSEKGDGVSVVVTSSLVELMEDLGWSQNDTPGLVTIEEGSSSEGSSP